MNKILVSVVLVVSLLTGCDDKKAKEPIHHIQATTQISNAAEAKAEISIDLNDGKKIIAPKDSIVEVVIKNQKQPTITNHVTNTSVGVATGISTWSGAVAQGYKSDLPNTKANAKGTSSDSGSIDWSSKTIAASAINALYWIGAIAILGGVVMLIGFKQLMLGLSLVIGGIVLIACAFVFETFPYVLLIAAFVVVGLIAYLIYRHYKSTTAATSTTDALTGIIKAIESAPTDIQNAVKEYIAKENQSQDGNIKTVVSDIKATI
jgi:hypothetical protein